MLVQNSKCSECGAPIRRSAGLGFCARCALQGAIRLGEEIDSESFIPKVGSRRFGDYELLDEVARGGMGVVYRARQQSLGRIVALKVLLGGAFAGTEGKRRLHAEAAAAARLRHPNIVAVYQAGEIDGQPFYSMDFIEGRTLAQLLQGGALSAGAAAAYLATISDAVDYAHSQGVLHRDLKPSNILIDQNDEPRVADFGLAKSFSDEGLASDEANLTRSGTVLGSPGYMSPEQATGRSELLGPRSDVYSLGAILYEAITGRPPFEGSSPHEVLEQVKSSDPVRPRQLNPGIPLDLETICLKCLEKEPERRYPTAKDLTDELRRFLGGKPVKARPIGPIERALRTARRHPLSAALSVISLALLITVAVISTISAFRIRHSRDEAQARLADSLVSEARSLRISGEPGYRAKTLTLIAEARKLDASGRIRTRMVREAAAALAGNDIRRVAATNLPKCNDLMLMCIDARFERCALWEFTNKSIGIHALSNGSRITNIIAPKPDELVAFSPDGALLLARRRNAIELWDATHAKLLLSGDNSEGMGLSAAAFSNDGSRLARAEKGHRMATYALGSDQPLTKLHEWAVPGGTRVASLAWSPDNAQVVLTTEDQRILLCDASDGGVRWEQRHSSLLWGLAWNGPLQRIAAHAQRDQVLLFDATDGALAAQIQTPTGESSRTAFSPDGSRIAISAERFGTRLFDSRSARLLVTDSAPSWHLHFDVEGRRVGTLFENGRPAWIELLPSRILQSLPTAVSSGANQMLEFSPDGRWLCSLTLEGPVIWDMNRRKRAASVQVQNAVFARFDTEMRRLLVSAGTTLLEVDLSPVLSGEAPENVLLPARKIGEGRGFWGIAVSGTRNLVAIADHKGYCIHLMDRDNRLVRKIEGIEYPGYVEFSPDGRWLTGVIDTGVSIWDLEAPAQSPRLIPGRSPTPRFSRDGRWLLPLGPELNLWRAGDWSPGPQLPFEPNETGVDTASFSPDGRWIAASQRDREVHLADIKSGRIIAELEAPGEGAVLDVAFSPDGTILVVARDRGEVQLWDLPALRRELAALRLDW